MSLEIKNMTMPSNSSYYPLICYDVGTLVV